MLAENDQEMFELLSQDEKKAFLVGRATRFFNRYGHELESVRQLLQVRLSQLAFAYTTLNNLPKESVAVTTRVKSLSSFLKKLEKKKWPYFYYTSEIAKDLIAGRAICWFLDDCHPILENIKQSDQFEILEGSIEDYIVNPKPSGYRSIHLHSNMGYDQVQKVAGKRQIQNGKIITEIQIRTKLQDAWGEFTHEIHYKYQDKIDKEHNMQISLIASRLNNEDLTAVSLKNILQDLYASDTHEGFIK